MPFGSKFIQSLDQGVSVFDTLNNCPEILRNAPIGIFLSTPEGKYLFVNKALARMHGYDRPEDLMGAVDDIANQVYSNPDDRHELRRALVTHGQVVNHECRQLRRDGSVIWVSKNVQAVKDQDGNIAYYQGFATEITDRKKAEQRLEAVMDEYEKVFNSTQDALFLIGVVNAQTFRYIRNNRTHQETTGFSNQYIRGKTPQELVGYEMGDMIAANYSRCLQAQVPISYEETLDLPAARLTWHTTLTPVFQDGQVAYIVGSSQNITQRKQAEKKLRETKDRLDFALQGSNSGMWDWYVQTGETIFNEQWAAIVGYSLSELQPTSFQTWMDLCHPDDLQTSKTLLSKHFADQSEIYECEVRMRHKDGSWVWVLDRGKVMEWDESGKPVRMSGIHTDITQLKNYVGQLRYLSLHDQLTGLYNRAYLDNELERHGKGREYPISIICMDLDGLKLINDTLGHAYGDTQLKACAQVLLEAFRSSDIVARVGGDEFVALLPKTGLRAGEAIVSRIQSTIQAYNQEENRHIPLSLSIGLACSEDDRKSLAEVYKRADDRMYQDKLHRNFNARSRIKKAIMAILKERDFITSGHASRLGELCRQVGHRLNLSPTPLSNLDLLAQVHDLGVVGIPEQILYKSEKLTEDEWEIVRQHPEKGARIAQASTYLAEIQDCILTHHERWDGTGYPLGLAGEDIPIECRILAIADAFDVMTSDRPYKKAVSVQKALEEIKRCAGTQFDPHLVEIFWHICTAG